MQMTNEEILRSYRQAMFPRKQLTILAELNLCSRSRIVEILIECGVDPSELPRLPKYQSGSQYEPTKEEQQPRPKSTRRWVWNPNRNKTAAETIEKAKARYEHLKKAHGENDPYVVGFKACIDYMEGK